jgi:hypothetical protein
MDSFLKYGNAAGLSDNPTQEMQRTKYFQVNNTYIRNYHPLLIVEITTTRSRCRIHKIIFRVGVTPPSSSTRLNMNLLPRERERERSTRSCFLVVGKFFYCTCELACIATPSPYGIGTYIRFSNVSVLDVIVRQQHCS